jgi:hypothetical protein
MAPPEGIGQAAILEKEPERRPLLGGGARGFLNARIIWVENVLQQRKTVRFKSFSSEHRLMNESTHQIPMCRIEVARHHNRLSNLQLLQELPKACIPDLRPKT